MLEEISGGRCARLRPVGTNAGAAAKPASPLNTAVLEAYIRHLLVWPESVDVTIGDPVPAPIPGFYAVKIRGTLGGRTQEDSFYVSADSCRVLFRGRCLQRQCQSVRSRSENSEDG